MYCMNCGAELPEGAKFCINCGTKVFQAEEQNTSTESASRSTEKNETAQDRVKDLTHKLGNKMSQAADSISSKIPNETTEAIGAKAESVKKSMGNMVERMKQKSTAHSTPSTDDITQEDFEDVNLSDASDQNVESQAGVEGIQGQEKNSRQKLEDKIVDKIGTKLGGKDVETIRISMEDMINLLKMHFIDPASTDDEYNAIQKTVNGSLLGNIAKLDSKDGDYQIRVSIMLQAGGTMDILNPGDSNWIRVTERPTGNVYQYSSFKWGPFKKAVKSVIEEAKNQTDVG